MTQAFENLRFENRLGDTWFWEAMDTLAISAPPGVVKKLVSEADAQFERLGAHRRNRRVEISTSHQA